VVNTTFQPTLSLPPARQSGAPTGTVSRLLMLLIGLVILSGCNSASQPEKTELFSISPPTFDGKTDKTITIPSQNYTLRGECDRNSHMIEYSLNEAPWVSLNVGCPTGSFEITVNVPLEMTVRVRAKGKTDYTTISTAVLKFVPVSTSPMFQFVQSSSSSNSVLVGRGTQNAMTLNFVGDSPASERFKMQTSLPAVIYDR